MWTPPFAETSDNFAEMCILLTDINRAIELLDKLQRTGEVPPQKLQALQRVLQSEFCNAVREVRHWVLCYCFYFGNVDKCFWHVMKYCPTLSLQVYEHVYETVDINSSPEVRANATAKVDPSQIPFLMHRHTHFFHILIWENFTLCVEWAKSIKVTKVFNITLC